MNKIHGSQLYFDRTKDIMEISTEAYVDSVSGNERSRRDMSRVFNDQDSQLNNSKLTN